MSDNANGLLATKRREYPGVVYRRTQSETKDNDELIKRQLKNNRKKTVTISECVTVIDNSFQFLEDEDEDKEINSNSMDNSSEIHKNKTKDLSQENANNSPNNNVDRSNLVKNKSCNNRFSIHRSETNKFQNETTTGKKDNELSGKIPIVFRPVKRLPPPPKFERPLSENGQLGVDQGANPKVESPLMKPQNLVTSQRSIEAKPPLTQKPHLEKLHRKIPTVVKPQEKPPPPPKKPVAVPTETEEIERMENRSNLTMDEKKKESGITSVTKSNSQAELTKSGDSKITVYKDWLTWHELVKLIFQFIITFTKYLLPATFNSNGVEELVCKENDKTMTKSLLALPPQVHLTPQEKILQKPDLHNRPVLEDVSQVPQKSSGVLESDRQRLQFDPRPRFPSPEPCKPSSSNVQITRDPNGAEELIRKENSVTKTKSSLPLPPQVHLTPQEKILQTPDLHNRPISDVSQVPQKSSGLLECDRQQNKKVLEFDSRPRFPSPEPCKPSSSNVQITQDEVFQIPIPSELNRKPSVLKVTKDGISPTENLINKETPPLSPPHKPNYLLELQTKLKITSSEENLLEAVECEPESLPNDSSSSFENLRGSIHLLKPPKLQLTKPQYLQELQSKINTSEDNYLDHEYAEINSSVVITATQGSDLQETLPGPPKSSEDDYLDHEYAEINSPVVITATQRSDVQETLPGPPKLPPKSGYVKGLQSSNEPLDNTKRRSSEKSINSCQFHVLDSVSTGPYNSDDGFKSEFPDCSTSSEEQLEILDSSESFELNRNMLKREEFVMECRNPDVNIKGNISKYVPDSPPLPPKSEYVRNLQECVQPRSKRESLNMNELFLENESRVSSFNESLTVVTLRKKILAASKDNEYAQTETDSSEAAPLPPKLPPKFVRYTLSKEDCKREQNESSNLHQRTSTSSASTISSRESKDAQIFPEYALPDCKTKSKTLTGGPQVRTSIDDLYAEPQDEQNNRHVDKTFTQKSFNSARISPASKDNEYAQASKDNEYAQTETEWSEAAPLPPKLPPKNVRYTLSKEDCKREQNESSNLHQRTSTSSASTISSRESKDAQIFPEYALPDCKKKSKTLIGDPQVRTSIDDLYAEPQDEQNNRHVDKTFKQKSFNPARISPEYEYMSLIVNYTEHSRLSFIMKDTIKREQQYTNHLNEGLEISESLKQDGASAIVIKRLFGHLKEIKSFHEKLLLEMSESETAKQFAFVFVKNFAGFSLHIQQQWMKIDSFSDFEKYLIENYNVQSFFKTEYRLPEYKKSLECCRSLCVQTNDAESRLAVDEAIKIIDNTMYQIEMVYKLKNQFGNISGTLKHGGQLILSHKFKVSINGSSKKSLFVYLYEKMIVFANVPKKDEQQYLFTIPREDMYCKILKDKKLEVGIKGGNTFLITAETQKIKDEWCKELRKLVHDGMFEECN